MRIATLDYLRGLSALGIMIYHYLGYNYGKFDVSNPLEKVGFYGVSLFYILSGLTLFTVYKNSDLNKFIVWKEFYLKRLYRIFPLLWIAIILTVLLKSSLPDTYTLFLNLSGLYGFFDWSNYIATGSWSIGNELVFYLCFPFLLAIIKHPYGNWILLSITTTITLYFSFYEFDVDSSIYNQWSTYINPFNQIPFFIIGLLIGNCSISLNQRQMHFKVLLIVCSILFFLIPVEGNAVKIVSGTLRITYFSICALIVYSLFNIKASINGWLPRILLFWGETSYGIYLYHPIVFIVVKRALLHINHHIGFGIKMTISVILTFIISYVSYHYIELPITRSLKIKIKSK